MKQIDWLDTIEYPFQSHYLKIGNEYLHYIDEGEGDVLLFVHGTPSWSFDFRNVIKELKVNHRCIAIDHIGFGLSSKPKEYDYSLKNHIRTLSLLIEHLNIHSFSLVMHDFGAIIGLSYALNNTDKLNKLVVLNTWFWNTEHDPNYRKLKAVLNSPLLKYLYLYFNFSAAYLLPNSIKRFQLTSHLKKQYTKPFAKISERYGTLAFAKSLLNDQNWFESQWQRVDVLKSKKILFIWGMNDDFISADYLQKFINKFKHAEVLKLNNCGHFPQEEYPEQVSEKIKNFI